MANKKKKKRKSAKYDPIVDFISPDLAIIQASTLLDAAAIRAIKSGNIKEMAIVSRGWLEVGGVLAGIAESRAEAETHELEAETQMGFQGAGKDGEPEDEEVIEEARVRIIGFRSKNV